MDTKTRIAYKSSEKAVQALLNHAPKIKAAGGTSAWTLADRSGALEDHFGEACFYSWRAQDRGWFSQKDALDGGAFAFKLLGSSNVTYTDIPLLWVKWLLSETSPWAGVAKYLYSADPEWIVENGIFLFKDIDEDLSWPALYSFAIATRMPYEYSARNPVFFDLVNSGISPSAAAVMYSLYSGRGAARNAYELSSVGGHTYISTDHLRQGGWWTTLSGKAHWPKEQLVVSGHYNYGWGSSEQYLLDKNVPEIPGAPYGAVSLPRLVNLTQLQEMARVFEGTLIKMPGQAEFTLSLARAAATRAEVIPVLAPQKVVRKKAVKANLDDFDNLI